MSPSYVLTLRASSSDRMRTAFRMSASFWTLLVEHFRVHWLVYPLVAACCFFFSENYRIGFNQTASLPQSVFLIHKNEPAGRGDYLAFRTPAGSRFAHEAILTKIVVGEAGDVVSVSDRIVFINGRAVGFAKTHSLKGEPLDPIAPTVIGADQVYVMGLHKDSLDSRYSIVGLIPRANIVGRAHPIW